MTTELMASIEVPKLNGSPVSTSTTSTLTTSTGCATAISTGTAELSTLSNADAALREEIELLKGQLQATVTARPIRSGWGSKNGKQVKLGSLSKEMVDNSYEIAIVIKHKLFPHVKFLPDNWEIYSTSPRTYCRRIMDVVVCDETMNEEGMSEKEIWNEIIAKIVALKFTMERNQSLQKLRVNFMSKSLFCKTKFVCHSNCSYNRIKFFYVIISGFAA